MFNENEMVPCILLLTHGKWGEELIKGAEMIVGPVKNIYAFPLDMEQSVEGFMLEVEERLKENPAAIILTDLFGGTTSNVALMLSRKYKCSVLSGLDIAMLIAADEYRTRYKGGELLDAILKKTRMNCQNLNDLMVE